MRLSRYVLMVLLSECGEWRWGLRSGSVGLVADYFFGAVERYVGAIGGKAECKGGGWGWACCRGGGGRGTGYGG